MRHLFFIIAALLYYIGAWGQLTTHPLSDLPTTQKGGIDLYSAEFISARQEGKETVWRFNFDKGRNEAVEYTIAGDTLLSIFLPGSISRLSLGNDEISILSHESPLTKIVFTVPMLFLPATISYGDSLSAAFSMVGKYCQKYPLRGNGLRTVACDAYGKIIENERDTITGVLLIHCTDNADISTSLPDQPDTIAEDMQKIGETYIWLNQRTGLPIYKYDITTYSDSTGTESKTARTVRFKFITVDETEKDNTLQNDDKQENNIDRRDDNNTIDCDIINKGDAITIYYNLQETADVAVALCDVAGISYFSDRRTCPAGDGYSVHINTAGLRRGSYVIYISVNGNTNDYKINIDRP